MHGKQLWTWRLWGLKNGRLDLCLTVATVLLLAASRLLLLADGPWEQDETLFARALLGFDLAAHFPHPPGFPLWLFLGGLILPMAPSPLTALHILSAGASILLLWPLAAVGRRVASRPVAAAAAIAVLFLPGVWFHSVRGFTSVPAALPAMWAAALAAGGLQTSRRAAAFFALLAASVLIRPILLPPLLLLALAGARTLPWRRVLLPLLPAAVLLATAGTVLAIHSGGWRHLSALTLNHAHRHGRDLVWNVTNLPRLGWVRGLGGGVPAVAALAVTVVGLGAWRRRSRGQAVTWLVVVGTGLAQLLLLQNPTHPRYAVPFQLALAPAAAGAAGLLPAPVGTAALLAAGGAFVAHGAPAVLSQHRDANPVWQAVEIGRERALAANAALLVEPAVYPFVSYREKLARRRGEQELAAIHLVPTSDDRNVDPGLPPWAGRLAELRRWRSGSGEKPAPGLLDCLPASPWLVVTDRPRRFEPAPGTMIWTSPSVPQPIVDLSQGRFLSAAVLASPPLALEGWWEPEQTPAGDWFRWGRSGARLWVPPAPAGGTTRLRIRPFPDPEPLRVTADGEHIATLAGEGGEQVVVLPQGPALGEEPLVVQFLRSRDAPAGPADARPLAIQWLGAAITGPVIAWAGQVATPGQRAVLGVEADGVWHAETFPAGKGCWTRARSRLTIPAGPGVVELSVSAPRPGSPAITIACGDSVSALFTLVGEERARVAVTIPDACVQEGTVILELEVSPPYFPREAAAPDPRELGVVLHHLRFTPDRGSPGLTVDARECR